MVALVLVIGAKLAKNVLVLEELKRHVFAGPVWARHEHGLAAVCVQVKDLKLLTYGDECEPTSACIFTTNTKQLCEENSTCKYVYLH